MKKSDVAKIFRAVKTGAYGRGTRRSALAERRLSNNYLMVPTRRRLHVYFWGGSQFRNAALKATFPFVPIALPLRPVKAIEDREYSSALLAWDCLRAYRGESK
jgi:hypothetical protein